MENNFSEYQERLTEGPEHWEGRSQSDWDGSCVVITRKEDKGRIEDLETSLSLRTLYD